jgi:hypothetical protein
MGIRLQFIGLVGSGKSYLSASLATEVNGEVIPFAREVYRLATLAKGGPVSKLLATDRELLKAIGTDWGREARILAPELEAILQKHKPREWGTEDIWAKIFIKECNNLPSDVPIFNDDTRFANEIKIAVREAGFIPFFVSCTPETRAYRLSERGDEVDANNPAHKSEKLANILAEKVMDHDLMPVVWNDSADQKPDVPWVITVEHLTRLVVRSKGNNEIAEALHWDFRKLEAILISD